jgi:hypothetical protein
MNTDLSTARAHRINELHEAHLAHKRATLEHFTKAVAAAAEAGSYIREIGKLDREAWLRENCPNITKEGRDAYLKVEARFRKRNNQVTCHDFFALLGMADEPTHAEDKPMKNVTPQWIAWTGKLTGHFSEMIKQTPPSSWDETQRIAVAEQLKPIVEIYERITKAEA